MAKSFSLREAIKFGWETWKEKWAFFTGLMLILFLLSAISLIQSLLTPTGSVVGMLSGLLMYLASLALGLGMIKIYLGVVDGGNGRYRDLLSFAPYFIKYLLAMVLIILIGGGIALTVGVLEVLSIFLFPAVRSQIMMVALSTAGVFLVAFLWFMVRLQFFGYLVVDQGLGPVRALKRSWCMTRGASGRLVLFWLTVLLMLLPAVVVMIGWVLTPQGIYLLPFSWTWQLAIYVVNELIAMPVYTLAMTRIYRKLSIEPEAAEPVIAAPAGTM